MQADPSQLEADISNGGRQEHARQQRLAQSHYSHTTDIDTCSKKKTSTSTVTRLPFRRIQFWFGGRARRSVSIELDWEAATRQGYTLRPRGIYPKLKTLCDDDERRQRARPGKRQERWRIRPAPRSISEALNIAATRRTGKHGQQE